MTSTPSPREQLDRLLSFARRAAAFWKRGLLLLLICTAAAVPYVFTRPRDYRSETVILYHETIHSSDLTAGGEGGSESARRVGARLRELLLTRTSLEPIIQDLKLFQDKIIRGELIGAVEEMRKHITFRAREGDTFEIAFVGSTPEEAQEVTKRLGECIIQEAASRRTDQAKTLKEFLNGEATRNETDLKQKELELTKFVVLHPEFAPRLQGLPQAPTPLTPGGAVRAPTGGDPLLGALEARAARIEHQLRAAEKTTVAPPKPAPTFQPPPESGELVAARRDLADKLGRYTDKHPDVIAARNRLRAAEQAQAATEEAAAAAFAAARRAAQADDPPPPKNATEEATLRKELTDLQGQIAARRLAVAKARLNADGGVVDLAVAPTGGVELEVEFRRLQREVTDGRDRQQKLEDRLFRASITASSVMNDRNIQVSVLDPAYLPIRPVSKPRSTLLAGLLALSIFLGIGLAFASAALDDRIYDQVDLERIDVLPIIAVIPRVELPEKKHRALTK